MHSSAAWQQQLSNAHRVWVAEWVLAFSYSECLFVCFQRMFPYSNEFSWQFEIVLSVQTHTSTHTLACSNARSPHNTIFVFCFYEMKTNTVASHFHYVKLFFQLSIIIFFSLSGRVRLYLCFAASTLSVDRTECARGERWNEIEKKKLSASATFV